MSKKTKKDTGIKTFSITELMMADLMFFLRPLKERQQEVMFWANQLKHVQDDIVKNQGIDSTKYSVDWDGAYRTGKMVCTKIPEPVIQKEVDKNGQSKTNSK